MDCIWNGCLSKDRFNVVGEFIYEEWKFTTTENTWWPGADVVDSKSWLNDDRVENKWIVTAGVNVDFMSESS
jgi:hypothetical protein